MNKQENVRINNELKELYENNKDKHLKLWKEAYKYTNNSVTRLNEFGIIDVDKYVSDNGILVICRETNGEDWYKNDFKGENALFTDWMRGISNGTLLLPSHPNIWYNTARYIMTVQGNKKDALEFENKKLLPALGTVAFTNINKVGGGSNSGKAYWKMYNQPDVINLIVEEIKIIEPKYIILCDKYFAKFLTEESLVERCPALKKCIENNRFFTVYHPAARMSKEKMLNELEKQIKGKN